MFCAARSTPLPARWPNRGRAADARHRRPVAEARDALRSAVGDEAVADASAGIAMFNIMDRIADATGIPVEDNIAHDTREPVGDELGMTDFASERRSAR